MLSVDGKNLITFKPPYVYVHARGNARKYLEYTGCHRTSGTSRKKVNQHEKILVENVERRFFSYGIAFSRKSSSKIKHNRLCLILDRARVNNR
jgi:hypothetical protein